MSVHTKPATNSVSGIETAELPPPTYEDATKSHSLLDFVDFWPKNLNLEVKVKYCKLESFESLMLRVNCWLKDNPGVSVITCETIEKKVFLLSEIYSDNLLFVRKGNTASKIKGLRLWLTNNLSTHPVQIDKIDVYPNIQQTDGESCKYPVYEGFPSLVERFNATGPVPGRILSIQTVEFSISNKIWNRQNKVDTNVCDWPDEHKNHKLYILRVFYERGPPSYEKIGSADFVPEQKEDHSIFSKQPTYADHGDIMNRASAWIRRSPGIRVTNLQTINTRYWKIGATDHSSQMGKRLNTQICMDYKVESRHRVLFVRVSYINTDAAVPAGEKAIVCQPVYPVRYNSITFESLPETKSRILDLLSKNGKKLLCAETLNHIKNLHTKHLDDDHTVYEGEWYVVHGSNNQIHYVRHKMLQHVRLYVYE